MDIWIAYIDSPRHWIGLHHFTADHSDNRLDLYVLQKSTLILRISEIVLLSLLLLFSGVSYVSQVEFMFDYFFDVHPMFKAPDDEALTNKEQCSFCELCFRIQEC